jgi:polyisoprenoid-binding protein YceI
MKPCLRFIAIVATFLSIVSSACADEIYKFDLARSSIEFRVHQMLGTVAGKFAKFDGKIDIDHQHPAQSSVSATIQVSSLDTGIAKRDTHLKSAEFFNAAKFPEITFKSRSVKQTGAQSADIFGDLTMHGVTRSVTLHVTLATPLKNEGSLQRTRWQVTTDPIRRREFGLMFGQGTEAISMIGQEVTPKIEIEAVASK